MFCNAILVCFCSSIPIEVSYTPIKNNNSIRDWSNEPTPLEVSQGQTLVIMNSGLGGDSAGSCQNSGSAFDEGQYIPQSPEHVNSATQKRCMIRDVGYTSNTQTGVGACWFSTPQEIIDLIGSTSSYDIFDGQLEGSPHARPHGCIGGNMATYFSPDDPVFYLHHTFVDYVWALWQDCHDLEKSTSTSAFNGVLTQPLSLSPYTSTTYTTSNVLDLSSYGIVYAEGPLFSNVVVDASTNCPGTINKQWFIGKRRRLRQSKGGSTRSAAKNRPRKRKKVQFTPFHPSQKDLKEMLGQSDELQIEVEECDNGRNACPIPDYFEDCSEMTDDEVNALTIKDIISMDGLNGCQIATREQEYQTAKNFGYLRSLCNGCMDPICDHSVYYEKCAIHDDNRGASQAKVEPFDVDLDYNIFSGEKNKPLSGYEVYVFYAVGILLLVNVICFGWSVCCKYYKKQNENKYEAVSMANSETDIEYVHTDRKII